MSADQRNSPQEDYRYAHRSSISMTQPMWDRLCQVVTERRDPKFTTSDAVREAIRLYIDQQADLIGSRKHFSKSLQRNLTLHEQTILFTLHAILLLIARMFVYIIKQRDGRDLDPLMLIHSSIVDSKKYSQRLIEAAHAVRQDSAIQPEA